jgi:hypothetical protein
MPNFQIVADRLPSTGANPPKPFIRFNAIDNGDGTATVYLEDRANSDGVSTPGAVTATGLKIVGSPAGSVSGSGTTNTIPRWTNGPASVLGDSLLAQSSGNIVQSSGQFLAPTSTVFPFTNPQFSITGHVDSGLGYALTGGVGVLSLLIDAIELFRVTRTTIGGAVSSFIFTNNTAFGISSDFRIKTVLGNGIAQFTNAAENNFDRLIFGSATAAFPALKCSGTELQHRLADDSGFAPAGAGSFLLHGSTSGVITIQGAAAAGTWTFQVPIDDGTPGQFLQTDGTGITSWETVTATVPGGADTQVQYNDGGAFGGDADFVWDKTTNTLSVATAYKISGTDWSIKNNSGFELVAGSGAYLRALSGGGAGELRIAGLLGFATGDLDVNAPIASIALISAGLLQLGTGGGGFAGSLKLTDLFTNDASFLIRTNTTLSDGAAAQVGTLTNAPTAGNPTKWIPIDDNGTTRFIPAW